MPLKFPDYRDYPTEWAAISLEIRAGRALHRCECTGECGQHHSHRCIEVNKQASHWSNGRIILSVAHLCNCYPLCANKAHLKAMCQKCHLRTDRFRHSSSKLRTQASASYKTQRYRKLGKELHIEDMGELANTPKHKRNSFWFPR